jgi:hypothetical protein
VAVATLICVFFPASYAIRIVWTEWSHKWMAKKKRKKIAPARFVETETAEFSNPVAPDLYCGECGARSGRDGGEFCSECGAPLKDAVDDGGSSWGSMEVEI